ncbi:Replication protein A DNA-binding subunit E [Nymphaea thermarum]|nr:Replication protein A DNA-binding subunit E [Nymphaea thermarum]
MDIITNSDGGEICVSCFNLVADQFYDRINVGKVYLISKGTLKPSKKNFNHLNNEWEIILESTSTIEPCLDEEDNSIPSQQQFNFWPISEIESMVNNPMVDIIGVVVSVHPPSTIRRKNGTETQKRYLQLKDMSGQSIELTLWGNFCNVEGQRLQEMCDSGMCPVLAVKAGRVSDFNGKSVMTISSSQLFIDPQFPEAQRLTEWFNRDGKNVATLSILRDNSMSGRTYVWKTLSQIKDEGLGRAEKPDWITVSAFVWSVNIDNFFYTACPLIVGDRQCKKKVTLNGDGMWHCDRLKVKEEIYGDEGRVRPNVVKAERLNFADECKYLLGLIGRLSRDDPQTNYATILHGGNSNEMNSASGGNTTPI